MRPEVKARGLRTVHAGSPGLHRITVATEPPCPVVVGQGAVKEFVGELLAWPPAPFALVTDDVVGPLHADRIVGPLRAAGRAPCLVTLPAGERHKTRATKERIEDALAAARFPRHGVLIALGGGVVTDLAGFAASTWMRGIAWCAVPTTLLGMVDAAIGGKTGVNLPAGKNLVGAFHQPRSVHADTSFLETLPPGELRQGLAECVKAGVIGDPDLYALLARAAPDIARDAVALGDIIARAAAVKARVVAADAREAELRAVLNYGHTIGHALERASAWSIPHGDAISLGMIVEARLAVRAGYLDRSAADGIEATLAHLSLPVRLPPGLAGLDAGAILEAARSDKKNRTDVCVFALPAAIGRMARGPEGYGVALGDDHVREALARIAPGGDGAPAAPSRPGRSDG